MVQGSCSHQDDCAPNARSCQPRIGTQRVAALCSKLQASRLDYDGQRSQGKPHAECRQDVWATAPCPWRGSTSSPLYIGHRRDGYGYSCCHRCCHRCCYRCCYGYYDGHHHYCCYYALYSFGAERHLDSHWKRRGQGGGRECPTAWSKGLHHLWHRRHSKVVANRQLTGKKAHEWSPRGDWVRGTKVC